MPAAGDIIRALDFTPMVTDEQAGSYVFSGTTFGVGNIDSGTYADCAVVFVAPTSGKVLIHFAAGLSKSGTTTTARIEPEVRTGATIGSGTVVHSPVDGTGLDYIGVTGDFTNGTVGNTGRFGATLPLSGLTPGATYNARLLHRVSAGTANAIRRRITVEPTF